MRWSTCRVGKGRWTCFRPTTSSRRLFFSGNPHLIQCVNSTVGAHSATVAASKALSSEGIKVNTLRCFDRLPSGKTFFQRFGFKDRFLPGKELPLLFVFANGDPPARPKTGDLRNATTIMNYARRESAAKVHTLSNDKDMNKHCVKRGKCILLLTRGEELVVPDWLNTFVAKNRLVRIASVDTKETRLSFVHDLNIKDGDSSGNNPAVVVLKNALTPEELKELREKKAEKRKADKAKGRKRRKSDDDEELVPFHMTTVKGQFSESALAQVISTRLDNHEGEWTKVMGPSARPTKIASNDRASKERRERREKAREQAQRQAEEEQEEKPVEDELELEDDETVVVSDDDEDEGLI
mmetsp:Transcript_22661/g.53605  ORF Transcript_22661/g.53605 Transcript_22661/m.53605 type:complete len:353 (+) Transcript_22661:124-1182(+)